MPTGDGILGKTPGERAFETYLRRRGLAYRYHPQLGESAKLPDYVLRVMSKDILCEVADFGESPADRKAHEEAIQHTLHDGSATVRSYATSIEAMTERLRKNIEDELQQLQPFRRGYSCVVVLFIPPFAPLDETSPPPLMWATPDVVRNALCRIVRRGFREVLSAVGILEIKDLSTPVVDRGVERALHEIRHDQPDTRRRDRTPVATFEEITEAVNRADDYVTESELGGVEPVMTTYHNMFASHRVPTSVFVGAGDQQYLLVRGSGETLVLQPLSRR